MASDSGRRRWTRAFTLAAFALSKHLDFDIIELWFGGLKVTVVWSIDGQQYRQSFFVDRTLSDLDYYLKLREIWPTEPDELAGLQFNYADEKESTTDDE